MEPEDSTKFKANEYVNEESPYCVSLLHYRFFDAVNDVAHVIIGHIRASREAEANLEERLLHTVGIDWSTGIDRLLVHWLPGRTGLDLLAEHEDTQGLDIRIRLAVSRGAIHLMNHTCGTPPTAVLITSL